MYPPRDCSNQSKVKFNKQKIVVDRFGAKQEHNHLATVEINTDCIKVPVLAAQEQRRIGRGSAGEVWLATYMYNGQQFDVAIKEIPVDQKESRDQFIQDLKAFINCNSPYIVKFYGCFYKEGFLNEVIEYMDMGSLRDIINFTIKNNKGGLIE